MLRTLVLILICGFCTAPLTAHAHSPYFSDPLDCPSAEGESFRFLFGDGLFGPDPMAIAALDAEGRLLAVQDVGVMSFAVSRDGSCRIVDWQNRVVWQRADPAAGEGALVLGDSSEAQANRWAHEPGLGREGVGFEATALNTIPLHQRLTVEAQGRWRSIGMAAILFGVGLALIWAVFALPRGMHWAWRIGLATLGLAGAAGLAMPVVAVQMLVPLSPPMVGVALAAAVALAALLRAGILRLRGIGHA